MRTYLYLTFDAENVDASEEPILALMTGRGYERVGSGFGFGGRDIEFKIPQPLTQEELNALALEARKIDVTVILSQDAWEVSDEGEMIEMIEEHTLEAAYTAQPGKPFFDTTFDQDASISIPYGAFEFEGKRYTVDLELWHEAPAEVWVQFDGEMAPEFYSYGDDLERYMGALNQHLRSMTRDESVTAEHDGIDFILL